jgi:hypothetical protein
MTSGHPRPCSGPTDGLKPGAPPHPRDHHMIDPQRPRQLSAAPVGGAIIGRAARSRPECGLRAEPSAWSPAAPHGGQTDRPDAAAQSGAANEQCMPNYSPKHAGWWTMIDLQTASRSAAFGARHRLAAPASALAPAVPDIRAATVRALFQAYRPITYDAFDFNVTGH